MKCKSCQGEVPPKFAHAIAVNCCPLCGEEIMEEELQKTLVYLKGAMALLEKYPAEILDWLESNYNLVSIDDAKVRFKEIVEVVKEVPVFREVVAEKKPAPSVTEVDEKGNQVKGETLLDATQTNKFFKNAEAAKIVERNQELRDMVNQIKKKGSEALVSEDGSSGAITPDMLNAKMDPEEISELHQVLFSDDEDEGVSSALDPYGDSDLDEIPAVVLAMSGNAKKAQGGYNPADIAKLQQLTGKSRRAGRELSEGGSVGFIRR